MDKEILEDDDRCGRPTKATTEENIGHVHRFVMGGRCLIVDQIANTVGTSHEREENILHNELGMSKVSSGWVPLLLSSDQQLARLSLSQANLAIFEADQTSFLFSHSGWVFGPPL